MLLWMVAEAVAFDNFEAWQAENQRTYATAAALDTARTHFEQTDELIAAHNAKRASWWMTHNAFSDTSWDGTWHSPCALPRAVPSKLQHQYQQKNVVVNVSLLPVARDWVADGAVSPVRDQGKCGSCWAFSTAGAVEGALWLATGSLYQLSAEELVQCATTTGGASMGCGGGWLDDAFMWMETAGLSSTASYGPYTSGSNGTAGACRGTSGAVAFVTSFENVPPTDEHALRAAVAAQPGTCVPNAQSLPFAPPALSWPLLRLLAACALMAVSVTVDADERIFRQYAGGVIDDAVACGSKQDHAVLIVGYGTDGATGKEYWRVKNSWGPSWGEGGYFRVERGKNICAIEGQPAAPKVRQVRSGQN